MNGYHVRRSVSTVAGRRVANRRVIAKAEFSWCVTSPMHLCRCTPQGFNGFKPCRKWRTYGCAYFARRAIK
jgi:hypothetical protein